MLFYEILGENCHQSNHDQTQLHWGDGFAFLKLGRSSHLQCTQVQAVVVVTVSEVVDEVASHRIYAIIHCSLVCPATCSSEVRFQSWGTCVQVAHHVGVVGPTFSKHVLKSIWELFKSTSLRSGVNWLCNQVKLLELFVCYISTKYTLNHVGSIKTVHAICSKCSLLLLVNLDIFWIIDL